MDCSGTSGADGSLGSAQDSKTVWKSYGRVGQLFRMETSRPVPTRAQQAGLRLEDVARPSLAQLIRRDRLDAKIRRALGRVLWRRRPKN